MQSKGKADKLIHDLFNYTEPQFQSCDNFFTHYVDLCNLCTYVV